MNIPNILRPHCRTPPAARALLLKTPSATPIDALDPDFSDHFFLRENIFSRHDFLLVTASAFALSLKTQNFPIEPRQPIDGLRLTLMHLQEIFPLGIFVSRGAGD